jgi:AbrB family looped-hinge helix DNA binding protein
VCTLFFEARKEDDPNMRAFVSETGRVTIPRAIRDRLGIAPGTVLVFTDEEGRLVAVKEQQPDAFSRWRGRGRLPGGQTVDEYLRSVRGCQE